jgi:membrane protein insertase Oxa1/YidC/SpoIIIJ
MLYWLTSNLLQLAQQWWLGKRYAKTSRGGIARPAKIQAFARLAFAISRGFSPLTPLA